jgi:hypothetical protein
MHTHLRPGASEPSEPENIRRKVAAALAAVGPLLLQASNAADGPDPSKALAPLHAAGRILSTVH